MKKITKLISLALAVVMSICASATISFAEEVDNDSAVTTQSELQTTTEDFIPIVFETDSTNAVTPYAQGQIAAFRPGYSATMTDTGLIPKFKFWAGGNPDAQVVFVIKAPNGDTYTQGPIPADVQYYIEKQYIMLVTGTWTFSAYISSGSNNGKMICYVKQTY